MLINNEFKRLKKVILGEATYYRLLPINLTTKKYINAGQLPNIELAMKEHDELVNVYKSFGVEVIMIDLDPNLPYQTFTRDFGSMTPGGAVISRMHVPERRGEPLVGANTLIKNNIPIAGFITEGTCEGGDLLRRV